MTNIVDQAAPYPREEKDVTADALARHLAAAAQAAHARAMDPSMDEPTIAATYRMVDLFGLVRLLRALIEHAPAEADAVALDLWGAWEDGSSLAEWLYEWLTEYGIDGEAIRAAVEAKTPAA